MTRRGRRARRGWVRTAGTFALLVAVLVAWQLSDGFLDEPWGPLADGGEWVDARFTRCGPGRGQACVVDGDTIKLGDRKIRIIGIDAPEVAEKARCPEEARMGEAATKRLQELLNRGRFEMIAHRNETRDQYGRDLRTLRRTLSDGGTVSIGQMLREEGLVRRYRGHKENWCG